MMAAMMRETAVHSFMVRFVLETAEESGEARWRGLIRHVQSGAELHFNRVEEALQFMNHTANLDGAQPDKHDPAP
jgi:hypothetical protein